MLDEVLVTWRLVWFFLISSGRSSDKILCFRHYFPVCLDPAANLVAWLAPFLTGQELCLDVPASLRTIVYTP